MIPSLRHCLQEETNKPKKNKCTLRAWCSLRKKKMKKKKVDRNVQVEAHSIKCVYVAGEQGAINVGIGKTLVL